MTAPRTPPQTPRTPPQAPPRTPPRTPPRSTPQIQCTAILFDLDGVLVHSAAAIRRSWDRWAQDHGIPVAAAQAAAHGRRTIDTLRVLAPGIDAAAEAARLEADQSRDTAGVTAGEGALDLLQSLPATAWAIVTSGTRQLALARLAAASLPQPAHLISADDVAAGKPAPDGYLSGAAALGCPPGQCVVLEDAAAGVQAGHRAGMRVIGIRGDQPPAALAQADAVVATLAELHVTPTPGGLRIQVGEPDPAGTPR
jgi:sugar-phosphatase